MSWVECKGYDRKIFLCHADLSGEELPMIWADTVKKLKHDHDYATDVVIRALTDVFRYTIVIVTAHGLKETVTESTKQTPDTSSRSAIEEGFKKREKWHRHRFRKNKKMECWESEWREEYNPGKSMWKDRSVEDDAEFRIKSETRDPLKGSDSNVIIISDTADEAVGNEKPLGTATRKLKRKRHCNSLRQSQSVVDLTERLSGLSSNDDSPVKGSKKARQTATSVTQSSRRSLFTSRQSYTIKMTNDSQFSAA
ncbi:uncharacterized protein [Montipora foliosa]|uniref:uncharacterized protein n=1 Tax=Montipora foliosa TaxID=591990 RepID=UPI0035F13B36